MSARHAAGMAATSTIGRSEGAALSRSGGLAIAAARLSLCGTAAVALLVLLLHAVKPEYAPSWRFISEYAIGANGWIMVLAFLAWSLSAAALFVALRRELHSVPGRIGNYLLLVVAVSLVFAGLFAADPITAKPAELTSHGNIHALASMVGIPGIPVAALLISFSLVRRNPAWTPNRGQIVRFAHLTWISLLAMAAYLAFAVPSAGGFTPEVWAGWLNRIVVAAYLLWQGAVAYRMAQRATG